MKQSGEQSGKVPVIDLASHSSADERDHSSLNRNINDVAVDVQNALELSGFFYITGHGIEPRVREQLMQSMVKFFAQPASSKQAIAIDQHNRGYLGFGEAKMRGAKRHDLKEVFFFGRELEHDDPDILAGRPLCAFNRWPEQPCSFQQDVLAYLECVQRVGDLLLQAIALSFGARREFFTPFYERPMARGQLIHYPAPTTDSNTIDDEPTRGEQFGVAEHTDFGCITLLHQGSPGLEVRDREGSWIKVPPLENSLVVNVGDLLERWTGGRAPSTRHRVRNVSGDSRYSIAIFYDPSPSAIVDPTDLLPSHGPSHGQSHALSTADDTDFAPIAAADYILQCSRGVFAQFK